MTANRINYREKARKALKKDRWAKDLIDRGVWLFIQKYGRLPTNCVLGFDENRDYVVLKEIN